MIEESTWKLPSPSPVLCPHTSTVLHCTALYCTVLLWPCISINHRVLISWWPWPSLLWWPGRGCRGWWVVAASNVGTDELLHPALPWTHPSMRLTSRVGRWRDTSIQTLTPLSKLQCRAVQCSAECRVQQLQCCSAAVHTCYCSRLGWTPNPPRPAPPLSAWLVTDISRYQLRGQHRLGQWAVAGAPILAAPPSCCLSVIGRVDSPLNIYWKQRRTSHTDHLPHTTWPPAATAPRSGLLSRKTQVKLIKRYLCLCENF